MGKHRREYHIDSNQIYGNNKIWCNTKIITGSKYYNMLLTFFLYSIPYILSIIFFLKLGPLKLYINIIYISISSILYIIHIYAMIRGGCTDPGILPRQNSDLYYTTSRTNMRYKIILPIILMKAYPLFSLFLIFFISISKTQIQKII